MTNLTTSESPETSNSSKCTWATATSTDLIIQGNNNMTDWSKTKYKGKKTFENVPPEHDSDDLADKFICEECPGIVANAVFEFSFDNKNKCYRFIPNKEYTKKEISDICGGHFFGVLAKTENTIQITYKPYDHHNEPIYTEELILTRDEKN